MYENKCMAVIIGVDPGLTRCGYAVLSQNGNSTKPLAMGVITTSKTDPTPTRLAELHQNLCLLIEEFSPFVMAVEKVFFMSNQKSGISVIQAAGIAMAAGQTAGCIVREYAPTEIKKTITSWGGADKQQMQDMVKLLLGLTETPKPADAADAAAVALCHLAQSPEMSSEILKTKEKI